MTIECALEHLIQQYNEFQSKNINASPQPPNQALEASIQQFWQRVIHDYQNLLAAKIADHLGGSHPIPVSHIMTRLETILTGGIYRSTDYLFRDLKHIDQQHQQQVLQLDQLLIDYLMDIAIRIIVIPDANLFFHNFIKEHYECLLQRVQLQFPRANATDLLDQIYETLTTRHRDKLPPKLEMDAVINYILRVGKYLRLAAERIKKNQYPIHSGHALPFLIKRPFR